MGHPPLWTHMLGMVKIYNMQNPSPKTALISNQTVLINYLFLFSNSISSEGSGGTTGLISIRTLPGPLSPWNSSAWNILSFFMFLDSVSNAKRSNGLVSVLSLAGLQLISFSLDSSGR